MNQVFVSYRHESNEHGALVRKFCEKLKSLKLPVAFDQFLLEEFPGGPDDGWRQWCETCAETSACVLIVCSRGWFDSYRKAGPRDEGKGAAIEAEIFAQGIYDEKGHNARVRLVILDDFKQDQIPTRLRSWHIFRPLGKKEEFDQMARWVRQRLAMPALPGGSKKVVYLAECVSDMKKMRVNLQSFLEDKGWQVEPSDPFSGDQDLRDEELKTRLAAAVGFVQILETYARDTGFDRRQDEVARQLGKPAFIFRDQGILEENVEPGHWEFLNRKDVISSSFEDFKLHVVEELEKALQRSATPVPVAGGVRRALVRVMVRSPERDNLWDKIFNWIDAQPDIRAHLLTETETFLGKSDPAVPCHGYLIICDGTIYKSGRDSLNRDMEDCCMLQLRERDDSRQPPAGIVYWPPPEPTWSKLREVPPPILYSIVGTNPSNLNEFFNEVRRIAQ